MTTYLRTQLYLDFSQGCDEIVRKIEGSENRGIGKICTCMCIEKKRLIFVFQPTFDEFSYLQGIKIVCNNGFCLFFLLRIIFCIYR